MATPYCLICHNIYIQTEDISVTPCGHVYHNECLAGWLGTSQTCPQCRNRCTRNQVKRIYIDFACDEDLAIAQTLKEIKKPANPDADAEEMIKMLLEHIDGKSSDEQQNQQQQHLQQSQSQSQSQNEDCDLCIAFQEAYDKMATEKDQLEQVLNCMENENQSLLKRNTQTMEIIEKLETEIQANEFKREQMEDQLEASEKNVAAIQSQNVANQHMIDELQLTISTNAAELNDMHGQVDRLKEQIKRITNEHAGELQQLCHGIQYIFNGSQQRKFLKCYCDSLQANKYPQTPANDSLTAPANTNECQIIAPYCGNIDRIIAFLHNSNISFLKQIDVFQRVFEEYSTLNPLKFAAFVDTNNIL